MKCKELMIGDWVTIPHGFPMQIVVIDGDSAYATWEGDEGYPWLFSDSKGDGPQPIPLTCEILEKNGFTQDDACMETITNGYFHECLIGKYNVNEAIVSYNDIEELIISNILGYPDSRITLYRPKVHELQHALRLCGLNELADNFKV